MVVVHRQWRWGTYGHTNPWAGLYTSGISESFFSEHLATLASETTQMHTATSISTTAAQHAAAQSTTDTPTQRQTSTGPVAMQTAVNTRTTTSPTAFVLSLAGETASRSASDHGATHSSGGSASGVFISLSSGGLGLTVSLPGLSSTAQPTAAGSSSTAQPIATGSSGNANSPAARWIGKGEIAAIVLVIVFALGLGGVLYYVWRRKAGRRRDSTFIQYPFSSDAATATMVEFPPHALVPPNTSTAEWDAHTDGAESPAATLTFGSPTGASGYGGGLAMYPPVDEKAQSRSHTVFYPATTPSPRSTTALIALPPPARMQLVEAEGSVLPYAWDHPPPSSEYLPRTPDHQRSMFRVSRGGLGSSPRRSSFGTVAATPVYSSGVPDADRRPPSYSRY
ncbi:hypothetical protein LXA43DRAFT_1101133 [Ganoderma leucocontextum]|nr:hypothetical protein LXA43DRAFT_1101133 [Ganoderma leucocontextum]